MARAVHQLIAAAAPADAVTGQALAWREALARRGVGGEVFAEHVHPAMAGAGVQPLSRLPAGDAAVVLRYSIWSAAVGRAEAVPADRLAIVYHNITPGHLLAGASPELAALCDRGRRELPRLAGRVRVAIADSSFNARELRAAGFAEPRVVPLLLDLDPPPPARDEVDPVVLTVGRVVPSKRIEESLRVLALLRRHAVPDARLEVVGTWDGFEGYRRALDGFAAALGVAEAVTFHGRVADPERDRLYATAGAYLTMSAHEGFCAPLLEALSRGLPVVASDAGAIPETLGGAGLVATGADPALAAEALGAVLTDAALRRALAGRAAARIADVAPEQVERAVLEALAPVLA